MSPLEAIAKQIKEEKERHDKEMRRIQRRYVLGCVLIAAVLLLSVL